LRKKSGVRADVVACRVSEFEEVRHRPNTLAYEADSHPQANRNAVYSCEQAAEKLRRRVREMKASVAEARLAARLVRRT
jgi:hypothetical protein